MTSRFETLDVTPDMARELLVGNTDNRLIRTMVVERYARDMQEGRWMRNGDTIGVIERADGSWWLRNGQHRLMAVMKSGETIALDFFIAPESEVNADKLYATYDQGAKRTFEDSWRGQRDRLNTWEIPPREVGNAVRAILTADVLIPQGRTEYMMPANWEKIQFALAHEDEVRWLADVRREYRKSFRGHMPIGMTAALVKCYRLDKGMAERFAQRLADGVGLVNGTALYALRSELIRGMAPGTKLSEIMYWYQITARAWNHHTHGREVYWLKAGSRHVEPLPPPAPGEREAPEPVDEGDADMLRNIAEMNERPLIAARRKAV